MGAYFWILRSQILHWNLKVRAYFFVRLNTGSQIFNLRRSKISLACALVKVYFVSSLPSPSLFHFSYAAGRLRGPSLASARSLRSTGVAILFPISPPLSFYIFLALQTSPVANEAAILFPINPPPFPFSHPLHRRPPWWIFTRKCARSGPPGSHFVSFPSSLSLFHISCTGREKIKIAIQGQSRALAKKNKIWLPLFRRTKK